MENNSDKQLRDKLSSTEFTFDPQAWEQMEAMLDKKKKRRGFFWWWTGGIAAVLVLAVGTIGWGVYLMDEDDKQPYETSKQLTVNRQPTTVNTIAAVGRSEQENTTKQLSAGNELQNTKSNGQRAKDNNENLEIKNQKSELKAKQQQQITSNKRNKESTASIGYKQSNQHRQRAHVFSKKKKLETILAAAISKKWKDNSQLVAEEKNPYQNEIEMLNTASAKTNAEENISLDRKEATLLEYVSENATTSFDKKEEDVLPKQKKKIFNYSLGVLANVTGTTLGKQDSHVPGDNVLFYQKPSYMVGLTHDFLFINRIAITNSILFSQTSFEVYDPKTISFATISGIYTSHITEIAIPIGIKVYPVVKNNFRFYINTGIINHIKLKETFDYYSLDDTAAHTATANLFDQAVFPTQTNFTGSYTPSALGVQGSSYSTKDFAINNAKRYYASFYAGAGFEYIAKKHLVLFAEPMFYMSLQKIGVQDKRKYNFGLSGGFRYQF